MTNQYIADVKEFDSLLSSMDNSKDNREKFHDFLEMAYCALAKPFYLATNNAERADQLEARYMKVVARYRNKDDIRNVMPRLLALVQTNAGDYKDYLGDVAGEGGYLNSDMGQFFTPIAVSNLLSRLSLPATEIEAVIQRNGYFTISDPAVGAGSTILAAAETVRSLGYSPTTTMLASVTDLSLLAYQMCYIQLSCAGIPAGVHRANTISMEEFESAWTFPAFLFYQHHGHLDFDAGRRSAEAIEKMRDLIVGLETAPQRHETMEELRPEPQSQHKEIYIVEDEDPVQLSLF